MPWQANAAFGWASLAALVIIAAILAHVMIRASIMDIPAGRKAHARPTPKAGGIAAIGTCMAIIPIYPMSWGPSAIAAMAGAMLLGAIGLLDDLRDCRVAIKLAAQTLAALLVVGQIPWHTTGWGLAGALLAIFWLIFFTNMFNFMDGLDGLAAGTGLIAALALAGAAQPSGITQAAALALAAGLAGFLPYNLPRARLFLGDTGSQFCGFLLAVLGLGVIGEAETTSAFWLPPLLFAGMILDVTLTLARRMLRGARLTTPHREHFYQRARLPAWAVMLAHWSLAALGALTWAMLDRGQGWPALPLCALAHGTWLGFAHMGGPPPTMDTALSRQRDTALTL